jgi:hypothetical protein
MITDGPLTESTRAGAGERPSVPGERIQRLQRRRRLVREEILAIAVLVVLLAVTVLVLATQWLESGPSANASAFALVHLILHGGTT